METPQINIIENDDGTVKYSSMSHSQYSFSRLDSFRTRALMTDVELKVKDKLSPCHKVILMALSTYFEGMFRGRNFSESTVNTVVLQEVSADAVDCLLMYMYTGSVIISEDVVADLLFAAKMWQMKDVVQSCRMFLKRLLQTKKEKAVFILFQSILYEFTDLKISSQKCICENFDMAFKQPESVQLSFKEMAFLMGSKQLSAPKEIILNSVVKWLESNQETDQMNIILLFSIIPLNLVNLECLRETYNNELLQRFPLCAQYLKNVIDTVEQSSAFEVLVAGQNVEQSLSNEIYVVDAYDYSRSLFKFNIETGHCNRIADVPHDHNCIGSAFMRNKIFAIDAWYSCNVSKYDPQLNTWSSCRPLPYTRLYSTVAVLNETIYVCGGWDINNIGLKSVVKYNLETDKWTCVGGMQQHRRNACAAELNGFLYVIGGRNGINYLSSCERYSSLTNRWESISPLPSPRSLAVVVPVNNSLYVLGGLDGRNHTVSSVFKYDLSSGSWSSCAEMPYSGYTLSACAVGGNIFVSGGQAHGRLKKSALFNINLNSWTEGPEFPRSISRHSSFPVI